MKKPTTLRNYFLALLLLFSIQHLFAQSSALNCNEVTPWTTDVTAGLVFDATNCGGILPPCGTEVIDNDLNNFHSISTLLTSGTVAVEDPANTYSASATDPYFVGFNFTESSVLNLDLLGLLNNVTISTFNNGALVESQSGSNLSAIGVGLLSQTRINGGFIATQPFDEIRITFAVGLLSSYEVYHPILQKFCATDPGNALVCNTPSVQFAPQNPVYINSQELGVSGVLTVNAGVTNSGNILDNNTANFATISNTVGAISDVVLPVANAVDVYPANTFTGFTIEQDNSVAVADVLGSITVETYLNGVLRESIGVNTGLVDVNVLSGVSGKRNIGFQTTLTYNEVRLRVTPTVAALSSINVYDFVVMEFCAGPSGICNTPSIQYLPQNPMYINNAELGVSGILSINANVDSPDNLIDDDPLNFATINNLVGAANDVTLPVVNAVDDYPANTFVGFRIELINTIATADVLGSISIETYLDGTLQETVTSSSGLAAISLGLLSGNSGKQTIGFMATQPFNEARLKVTPLVGALTSMNVYDFVATPLCANTLVCFENNILTNPDYPVFVNFVNTGTSGVGSVGQVNDADNVVNSDTADFAELEMVANVLNTTSLSVQDPLNTYPVGSMAGFVVESGTSGLLVLDLLENLTVTTYLDGTLQESQSASNLLDLELLGLLGNQNVAKRAVGFYTTLEFDEIQISYGGLVTATLNSTLNVFYAFAETSLASDGGSLTCCPTIQRPTNFPAEQWIYISQLLEPIQIESTIETPSGISWILFAEQQTGSDMYTGGTKIAETTVDGNTQLTTTTPLVDYFSPYGTYYIYGISTGLPADPTCRPFAEYILHVQMTKSDITTGNVNAIISGDVSTNDIMLATTTYGNLTADPGNPSIAEPVLQSDGTFTFSTPTAGVYHFTIDVCDNSITPEPCKAENLTILIREPRAIINGPLAGDDYALVVGSETAPANTVVIPILNNDAPRNIGGSLTTPTITTAAQNGTANIVNGELEYTPNVGFYGTDTVVYQVCETPSNLCATAFTIISVAQPDASAAVVASDDLSVSKQGEAVNVGAADGLMANDFSTGSGPMSVTADIAPIPNVGTLIIGTDGGYTFTPDPNFVGTYNHTYEICDNGVCDEGNLLLVVEESIMLWDIKFFLEGPFDASSGVMTTNLSAGGSSSVLAVNALSQPYNAAPWNYTGTESVSADFFDAHPNITDWVLVELRDPSDPTIVLYQKACFLTSTGDALDVSGYDGIQVNAPEGSYYVSVVHRNHANVASLNTIDAQSGTALWDIRTDNSNVYTTGGNPRGVKEVINGGNTYYVLHGGDCDNNQNINSTDRGSISIDFFKSGYYLGDTFLDGTVNSGDQTIISRNFFYSISFY